MTCDFTYNSGRGDDCVAAYVAAAKDVPLDCPPGTALSYSSLGYAVLGRVVGVLTGQTWDAALRDRLFTPLGLSHSMTLPEEALRFRAAMGHLGAPGHDPGPAPAWDPMPRSAGPYGRVIVSGDGWRLGWTPYDWAAYPATATTAAPSASTPSCASSRTRAWPSSCWPTAATSTGCTPPCSPSCWRNWPACGCRTPSRCPPTRRAST
ncbi:serine hydrolase [Sphaerisporangium sp. TRM90804]|uniref:serine hydrolase domain-containing protein n=1 Tax=Sphaerisporangium sp. TRM90804 TaxID=3031113 RepID=UPI0024485A30|nr:serine hydrolase [Sphaerisporangium sp. TRM90804]MDH2430641.1 serine hydrolase [Sphaerisporangium sp. TRM90804]